MYSRMLGYFIKFDFHGRIFRTFDTVTEKPQMTQAEVQPFGKFANIDCIGFFN